jgi:hypothetical protein
MVTSMEDFVVMLLCNFNGMSMRIGTVKRNREQTRTKIQVNHVTGSILYENTPQQKIWQGDTPTTQHLSGICLEAYLLGSNSANRNKRESGSELEAKFNSNLTYVKGFSVFRAVSSRFGFKVCII